MEYRHTQTATWHVAVPGVIAVVLLSVVVVASDAPPVIPVLVAVIALAAGLVFGRLTVTVDATTARAAFGPGRPARSIDLTTVTDLRVVRNHWYHGWGIRWIGNGWMYNVGGYDAVELDLSSGKRFRIGTDEPDALAAAISARLR